MDAGDGIRIRDADASDAEGIARTHIACWQEAYVSLLPQTLLEVLDETFERRRSFWLAIATSPGPREALVVAERDGGVIGFVHVCPSRDEDANETVGELTAIYVRKAYWGRGIGRALLAEASERLRGFGFSAAMLWVLATNERTRRFYEAAGWMLDGSEKEERIGDLPIWVVRYRVSL